MRLDLRGRRSYAETIECTEHHLFQTGDATGNPFDNVFEASIPIAPETMRATVTIDPKRTSKQYRPLLLRIDIALVPLAVLTQHEEGRRAGGADDQGQRVCCST